MREAGSGFCARACLDDRRQRVAGLGLDLRHVHALLVRGARERSHRAKNAVEVGTFESLETRIHDGGAKSID